MKITLIMPGVGRKPGEKYVNSWKMEPLPLAVLAAATPPEVEVCFYDDRLEAIPYDEPTDLVGINVETYTARRSYAIAAQYRARVVPVVLGGYHPTLVPHEAMNFCDAIVEGEGEAVWPQVIEDAQNDQLQKRYRQCGGHRSCSETFRARPRREIFAGKKYMPVTLIETGRGCPFSCEFCSVSQFFNHTAVARQVDDVVAEVEASANRTVFFVDDNIVADMARAKRLFAALDSTKIRWLSQGSITMADDPELLRLMRRGGCRGILIGFESLSKATLSRMGKSWNNAVRDFDTSIQRIRDAGLAIYATFVFGYDTDDADAFERTLDFAIHHKFYMAAFNHLVPFPGTPLYDRLKAENRLLSDPWWLDENYRFGDVAFQPRTMSAGELSTRCFEARKKFYRFGSTLRRACDLKSNCRGLLDSADYFWLNLFSGREMRKRQGLPLGDGFEDDASADLPKLNNHVAEVPRIIPFTHRKQEAYHGQLHH
jgi:radical SAM superfamily enzyme YgiQ (UPF0313 family)